MCASCNHSNQSTELRQQSQLAMVESIAVFIFALFLSVFLPQLLFKYLYANQPLTQEPALLTYIPVISFALGTGYFLYAFLGNMMRNRKIAQIEKSSMLTNFEGSDMDEIPNLEEMEAMVDEILKEADAAKPKKKAAKKPKKKTAKKSK